MAPTAPGPVRAYRGPTLACLLLLLGCRGGQPPLERDPMASDPCAERLHNLSGLLLEYYVLHKGLPETLEELRKVAGPGAPLSFECPTSGQPYLYEPRGEPAPGRAGAVVIRDPLPVHLGMRWAVVILKPDRTQPLNTRVIALPEKAGSAAPPGTAAPAPAGS